MEKYHALTDELILTVNGLSETLKHYYKTVPAFSREASHTDLVGMITHRGELNAISPDGWELHTIVSKLNPYDGYRYRYTEFVETVGD